MNSNMNSNMNNNMKIKDFVSTSRNKANNQISFNLKARQLKKLGLTPQYLLNLKVPQNSIPKPQNSIIIKKEVKSEWKK